MSRPFTRSQASFLTPVKVEPTTTPNEPKKTKKQLTTEDKKEVKRNLDFTPTIVIPEEVKEVCLCGQDCDCEACHYEFYAERNQIHHDHSDKGEICYGTECKMCPHSVIPEQWEWEEECDCETDEECVRESEEETSSVGMGTTQIFKFESNIKMPSNVGMGTTVVWENTPSTVGMGTTSFVPRSDMNVPVPNTNFWKTSVVAEEYDSSDSNESVADSDMELDSSSESITSVAETASDSSSDSESDSDYVPSESESDSDVESDAESQEWNSEEEYYEDCEDILTSQMMDLYGRIYYVREKIILMNDKSKISGKWTKKMDIKYEKLLQPVFNDEWYNELQRMRKTLGKYSTRTHMRMMHEMNEMVEEISTL